MVKSLLTPVLLAAWTQVLPALSLPTANGTCNTTFTPITASAYISSLTPGWNLGNTLDAIETEGSWNNPPVVATVFDDIKAAGFKSIRLPITWAYHFTSGSPTWDVDTKWMDRVEQVVDWIVARGMPVVVNVHHDSWVWADISKADANFTMIEEKFDRLWRQIGERLKCKSALVSFEPMNEMPGDSEVQGKEMNKLNGMFLQAINDAGGHNPQRVVTLVGVGEDAVKTVNWFERPDAKWKNPWALQYHYYSPYDFIFGAWGKTTWGSAADKSALEADLAAIRGNFTDVPLVIGEWSASSIFTEPAARWHYFDFFTRTAAKYNTATMLWDNGLDQFDRPARKFRDQTVIDVLMNAAKGKTNALPQSTTDGAVTTQESSAYIWHKASDAVMDVSLAYEFNGLTLSSIKNQKSGKDLKKGTDYKVAGSNITFTSSFLKTVITSNTTGSLANLSLKFSSGAPSSLNIIQYSTPTLGSSTAKLPSTSADLFVPVKWAGLNTVAAVRALKADGTILIDDWTQWLGPLQQGRLTYSGQWDWDSGNVIIKAAVLDAIRSAGQTTTLMVEFWPRTAGNVANFTITV